MSTGTNKSDIKNNGRRTDGKVGRIAEQARGLADDVRTWVDLKLQLFEIQVEERIEHVANKVAVGAATGFFAFLAITFGLVSAALALGSWWNSPALGFLAVAAVLALIAIVLFAAKPRVVRRPVKVDAADRLTGDRTKKLPAAKTEGDHANA